MASRIPTDLTPPPPLRLAIPDIGGPYPQFPLAGRRVVLLPALLFVESPLPLPLPLPLTRGPASVYERWNSEELTRLRLLVADGNTIPPQTLPPTRTVVLGRSLGEGSHLHVFGAVVLPPFPVAVAIKLPRLLRNASYILREALALSHVWQHAPPSLPIIRLHGIVFLTKQHFRRVRHGEMWPALAMDRHLHPLLEQTILDLFSLLKPRGPDPAIGRDGWVRLCRDLVEALMALEAAGVVHADIKSANILCRGAAPVEGFVLADFSAARVGPSLPLTPVLQFNSTLQFMAPELLVIPPTTQLLFHTDLYAAGLVLFHALVGQPPYAMLTGEQVEEPLADPVTPPPQMLPVFSSPHLDQRLVLLTGLLVHGPSSMAGLIHAIQEDAECPGRRLLGLMSPLDKRVWDHPPNWPMVEIIKAILIQRKPLVEVAHMAAQLDEHNQTIG